MIIYRLDLTTLVALDPPEVRRTFRDFCEQYHFARAVGVPY